MHFRSSICKAFDPGLLSQVYIHCNIKGGNQRVWESWMKPVLLLPQTWSFKITRMSNGDPGWVETRIIILQSHFPDRFLEAGKECGNSVMKKKTVGALCMRAWVQMSLREKQCNWAHRFCQPGKQMHSYFLRLCDPWLSHSRRQSKHVGCALIISGMVTIDKIFYIWQSFMRCFFTIRDLFLLLGQNTVSINCRHHSSIIQLHVRGTSHLIQWMWVFLGHCNWWF